MLTKLSTILNMVVYNSVDNYIDMNTRPPISFRFTDRELEVLEREKRLDESINQTAARLLRVHLGIIDSNEHQLEEKTLERWITDSVNQSTNNVRFALETMIEDKIAMLEQKLEEIEKKLPKPRTKKSSSAPDSEA
jgi:hypothetical protein